MSRLCLVFLGQRTKPFVKMTSGMGIRSFSLWVSEIVQLDDLFMCFLFVSSICLVSLGLIKSLYNKNEQEIITMAKYFQKTVNLTQQ